MKIYNPASVASVVYGFLTALLFRVNAAFGTFGLNPQRINDNDTGTEAWAGGVGQFAQVDFPAGTRITQFRQFGNVTNNGDGTWELAIRDAAGVWQDWVLAIATRDLASWSGWDSSGGEVICSAIRLVCRTVDTAAARSRINQLEVKH